MYKHELFATEGLYPGLFKPIAFATVGAFTFDITIEPVYTGGGGGYIPGAKPDKYKITIRVNHKGKIWKIERVVSRTLAKVTAKLVGIELEPQPQISINSLTVTTINDPIKVKL